MARGLKYGEETVLFAKKVPKSKLSKVEDLVEKYLGTVEIDVKKNIMSPAPDKIYLYGSQKGIAAVENAMLEVVRKADSEILDVHKDILLTGQASTKKIVIPRVKRGKVEKPLDVVDSPPAEATEMGEEVITGKVVTNDKGVVAYPCGCLDDGLLRKNPGCKYGDQANHKIFFVENE